jgi:hypothetical protein
MFGTITHTSGSSFEGRTAKNEDWNMKQLLAAAVAMSALAVAVPASAQSWQSINQRQDNLDRRIDQGVRNGQLTRGEAIRLRAEFNDLARLEARYRRDGHLSTGERVDLDRRFDLLSQRVRYERRDDDDRGGWQNVNAAQRQLDRRIEAGMRSGHISRREARELRDEFGDIVRLEARYRDNGLNRWERTDLSRRLDRLDAQITAEMRDRDNRRG